MNIAFPLKGSGLECKLDELLSLYGSVLTDGSLLCEWLALRDKLPPRADAVIILGSDFELVPYCASVMLQHVDARLIVAAGGRGRFTPDEWKSEGERYAEILQQQGVSSGRLLIENESSNTGENLAFSKKLLEHRGCVRPSSIIIIQYPLLQRRAWLTAKGLWPDSAVYSWAPFVASPLVALPEWRMHEWQRRLLWDAFGETARIIKYQRPEFGFIVPESVPRACIEAAERIATALQRDASAPPGEAAKAAEAAALFRAERNVIP